VTIATAPAPAGRVLVVVPTYNERGTLPELLGGITALDGFDVLVVDDKSPDGTGAIADEWAARMPGRVDVLHREGPRGLGRAYADGLARALERGAPIIAQMDADLSHDPKYLPDLVAALDGADLAIGSRYLNGISVVNWPLHRIAPHGPTTGTHAAVFDENSALGEALALMEARNWTAARHALHALAAKVPQSKQYRALLCYARGREAHVAGRAEEALIEYQRALHLDPDLAQVKQAVAELQRRR